MKDIAKLIKKIRLKKGCSYLLIVPTSTGLIAKDLDVLDRWLHKAGFNIVVMMVESSRGIKVIEKGKAGLSKKDLDEMSGV